jgi:hypothetical protein
MPTTHCELVLNCSYPTSTPLYYSYLTALHCLQSLLSTLESNTRRTQRCVLLRVTSLRSRRPSLLLRDKVITAYPSNTRNEGRGGKTRQRSATVAKSRSLRFLNFLTSRIGRLRHNILCVLNGFWRIVAIGIGRDRRWTGIKLTGN